MKEKKLENWNEITIGDFQIGSSTETLEKVASHIVGLIEWNIQINSKQELDEKKEKENKLKAFTG